MEPGISYSFHGIIKICLSGKQNKQNLKRQNTKIKCRVVNSIFLSLSYSNVYPWTDLFLSAFIFPWETNWPSQEKCPCFFFSHLSSPLYFSFVVQDRKSEYCWEPSIKRIIDSHIAIKRERYHLYDCRI